MDILVMFKDTSPNIVQICWSRRSKMCLMLDITGIYTELLQQEKES